MQVYKAYFKIIYKNLPELLIYVAVFLFFAVFLTTSNSASQVTGFTETKINIVFINEDKGSRLVEGLKEYLSENANLVNIEDDAKKLQDALFYRQVEYIIRVPKDFTEGLMAGKDIQLHKTMIPDSTSAIYMDIIINKYLNTAKIYSNNVENLSQERLVSYIHKDLAYETQVDVSSFNNYTSVNDQCVYFFNYLAYSLFSILILGVCAVMLVYSKTDLKRRNLCSPIKMRNMNFQMVLGNISFALISWFIMVVTSFIMYGSYMLTSSGLLFLLNSFIFALAALSISFLIANIIKNRNSMSAAANVVALGSCFISGVFVPQVLLGKTVLNIASFTPTYWYVKANNDIVNIANFNIKNLMPIFSSMLIVLSFAVAVLSVTLVIIKQKRTSA